MYLSSAAEEPCDLEEDVPTSSVSVVFFFFFPALRTGKGNRSACCEHHAGLGDLCHWMLASCVIEHLRF